MASCTMAVRWATLMWTCVLSSVVQDTLPYQYQPTVPRKTHEDANVDQLNHTLKTNNVGHSNPPARTIFTDAGDQDEISAADKRIVELQHNLNTSVLGAPELEPRDSEDVWAWKQLAPPEDIFIQPEADLTPGHLFPVSRTRPDDCPHCMSAQVVSANSYLFPYGDHLYGEIFSANAQDSGGRNAGISHVPSPHSSLGDDAVAEYVFLPDKTAMSPSNNEHEEWVEIIPLPALEGHNTKSVKHDFKNLRLAENVNRMLPYDLHWLPHVIDQNKHNQRSHGHYRAGKSGDEENNNLASDFEDVSTNKDNDKRKFDSISDSSSFGGFGKRADKRKFDSISDSSSFGGFGKRADKRKFDSISDYSSFGMFGKRADKRKFDSISDSSSFGMFGKRADKRKFDSISDSSSFDGFGKRADKRKFDSISDSSSFGGFGKRADKRKFDSISDSSSFGMFGKRADKRKFDSISDSSSFGMFGKRADKRKFDSISDSSSFGMFGKRADKRKFDSISDSSSFGGFGKRADKRKFDSISDSSSFGGFGKRADKRKFDSISDSSSFGMFGKRADKRKFDSISDSSSFGMFGKRQDKRKFDSISDSSSFGGFGKRQDKKKFDSISDSSSFDGFGKRQDKRKFDSISDTSSFGMFGGFGKRTDKRKFDSISDTSSFGVFGKRTDKRTFDPIPEVSYFERFGKRSALDSMKFDSKFGNREEEEKRKFDSISGVSSFGNFGKRQMDDRRLDPTSGLSSFSGLDRWEPQIKRTGGAISVAGSSADQREFDSISGVSSFRRFNQRQIDDRTKSKYISGYSSLGNVAAENNGLYFHPDVRSFENVGENTGDSNNQMANLDVKGAIMADQYNKSATMVNLADKSAIMYRKKRAVGDDVDKEAIIKQSNFNQRGDKYNTLFAETNDHENIDQANEERNPKINNKDSEDVDAWRTNHYSNMKSLDSVPVPADDQLSLVYSNVPLTFSVGQLDPTGRGSIFAVLGNQRLAREQFNNKLQQDSQNSNNVFKRRFDRISTQGNVFRSFGKRSADSVGTTSQFDELHKRHFDRISHASQFTRFGRNVLNRADLLPSSGLGSNVIDTTWPDIINRSAKRQYYDIFNNDPFTGLSQGDDDNGGFMFKRRFDSIDHNSPFRMFTNKGSDNDNFVIAKLDPGLVVIRRSYSFPEAHRKAPEVLTLHSPPHAAPHDVQAFFSLPRPDERHFDAIGHPIMFRRLGRYSSSRWS